MPELPEVETIVRSLRPALLGRTVQRVEILWEKTIAEPVPEDFPARIQGQRIRQADRRGKYLRLRLSHDTLLVHLRMSGDLRLQPPATAAATHDRLRLQLDDGHWLAFNDTRKFGRIWLTDAPQRILGKLGPEPDDPALTPARFHAMLTQRRRALKALLLEQRFLAGIGNIYADEALYRAQLHPLRPAASLTPAEADRLLSAIREVLAAGIAHNGTSIDWIYRGGNYQQYLNVYGREGQPCRQCNTPIGKIRIAQRGTHFCPVCQKE